jgi:ribosomal protein L28
MCAWAEIANKESRNSGSGEGTKYVNLKVGTTQLRVLDEEPISRWTHWIPQANEGKGLSVTCIGKGCPVCKAIAEDKKAKRKTKYGSSKSHAINTYVRSFQANGQSPEVINELQILDKGNKIFEQLLVYLQQMGDLRTFDVKIVRTGEEFGSISYTVVPVYPPTALEASIAELPRYDLREITKSLTAEQILQLMAGAKLETVVGTEAEGTQPDPSVPFSVDYTTQA